MKSPIRWFMFSAAAILVAGCASHPKPEQPPHQQGWIGGAYKCAKPHYTTSDWFFGTKRTIDCFPPSLEKTQKAGILATQLGTNTPAFLAGIREGDLILELGHQPITRLPDFWSTIRKASPGTSLPVKTYRGGATREFDVTVGREKYWEQGTFMVGLPGFWEPLHPIPTRNAPKLSLIALGWQRSLEQPFEFNSVESQYRASCHPKDKQEGYNWDWNSWLVIFKVEKGKKIVAQELASAPQGTPTAR